MRIEKILDEIEAKNIVLPEFQREYIWSREQAKQLLVSLINSFPTGSFLLWDTPNPPTIKNQAVLKKSKSLTHVILDGQQRLTTLYFFIKNKIPPYYNKDEIEQDPRNLYFNLETSYFEFYQPYRMDDNPLWQKVTDCFQDKVDSMKIIQQIGAGEDRGLIKKAKQNLKRLTHIKKQIFPVQIVPPHANIDQAIEIFDRINSQGTPLSDAELVLAHIIGKWPQFRRIIKKKRSELREINFDFNLDFITRCMVIALTNSASYKGMTHYLYYQMSLQDYQNAWKKVTKGFDYLIPVLNKEACIDSLSELSTENVLIPILAYLFKKKSLDDKRLRQGFLYWMFMAMIWRRYSGQTDQRLDKDVYLTTHAKNPIKALVNEIEEQRGRLMVRPDDLEGRGSGHPLHRMLFIVTKWKDAHDWVEKTPIRDRKEDYYSIHSQHIFSQAVLYKQLYNSESHLDRKTVNEIANRAFITRSTNYDFARKKPMDYLPGIEEEELKRQMIPQDRSLWRLKNYERFLASRRQLIATAINDFLNSFGYHLHVEEEVVDYQELIAQGENHFVEFKSVLSIKDRIAKTLVAFMNSEGGTLFIGIADNGEIIGIKKEYKSFKDKPNQDGFYLRFTQIINNYLGKEMNAFAIPKIIQLDEKEVFMVMISEATRPVFVKIDDQEKFYIRAAASSESLSPRATSQYIQSHWG